MLELVLVLGIVVCGFGAVRATQLLTAVLLLAATSALVSCLLYRLGAPEVAVFELSVGAGLVTILFVFVIAMAGETKTPEHPLLPGYGRWLLPATAVALLGWLVWPLWGIVSLATPTAVETAPSFATVLWQARSLDVLVQIGLIFAGVVGIMGLLAERRPG